MKKFSLVLTLLVAVSVTFSQEQSHPATFALSFGIGTDFRLQSYDYDITVKKIFAGGDQLRISLAPRVQRRDETNDPDASDSRVRRLEGFYMISGGVDYIWSILKVNGIGIYGGPGISLKYRYGFQRFDFSEELSPLSLESWAPTYAIGARGSIGMEWSVVKEIGIHAEYQLTALHAWTETWTRTLVPTKTDPKLFEKERELFLESKFLFGMSIYF